MPESAGQYRELDDLIYSVIDGDPTPEQVAELNRRVSTEASVAQRLIELSECHVMAQWLLGGSAPESTGVVHDALLMEIISQAQENRRLAELSERAHSMLQAQQDADAAARIQAEAEQRDQSQHNLRVIVIPRPVAWLGLAAAILAVAATAWVLIGPVWERAEPLAADPPPAQTLPVERPPAGPAFVATLSSDIDAAWSIQGLRPAAGGTLLPGRYELVAGAAEITMNSGAHVIMRSPCTFELVDDNRARLELGSVVANVPPPATGFTIESGEVRIVDLGTEFGVSVDVLGEIFTTVFDGEVVLGSQIDDVSSVPVKEGQSVGADRSGRLGTVRAQDPVVTRSLFARTVAEAAKPVAAAALYRQAVLSKNPLLYWRFDDPGQGQGVANVAGDPRWNGRVVGSVGQRPGLFGNAASFVNTRLLIGGVVSERPFDAEPSEALTMELWCWVQSNHFGTLADLAIESPQGEARWPHILSLEVVGDPLSHDPAINADSFRYLYRNPPSYEPERGTSVGSSRPYPVRSWVHLVAVKQDGVLRMYVDGQLTSETADDQPVSDLAGAYVGIGMAINPQWINDIDAVVPESLRPFDGLIDEVAVYRSALSAEQIQQHYQLGRPTP